MTRAVPEIGKLCVIIEENTSFKILRRKPMADDPKYNASTNKLLSYKHPSILSEFGLKERINYTFEPDFLDIEFGISCKNCGADDFHISFYPEIVASPSPYYGISPGEIIHRPPHNVQCTGCRKKSLLFDPRLHGYDGVVNTYYGAIGKGDEEYTKQKLKVTLVATYNIPAEELIQLSSEVDVNPLDLFDWADIFGKNDNGTQEFHESYECA
jgi:hypothetical protein